MACRDALNILVNIFASVLIALELGVYEVGLFALIRTVTSSLESLFRFPVDSLIPRSIAAGGVLNPELKSYALVNIYQNLLLLIVFLLCLSLGSFIDLGFSQAIFSIIFGTVLLRYLKNFLSYLLIGIKDFNTYNLGLLLLSCSISIFIIVLYVTDDITLSNVLLAFLLSELLTVIYFFVNTYKHLLWVLKLDNNPLVVGIIKSELALYKSQILTYVCNSASVYVIAASSLESLGFFHIVKSVAESLSKVLFSAFINVHSVSLFSIINKDDHWPHSRYVREFWALCAFMIFVGLVANILVYVSRELFAHIYPYDGYLVITTLMLGIISGAKLFFNHVFLAVCAPHTIYKINKQVIAVMVTTFCGLYLFGIPMYFSYSIIVAATLVLSFSSYRRLI